MKPDIKGFLKQTGFPKNVWLHSPTLDVYVRKEGSHVIEGSIRSCFDVANILVPEEHQRRGIFGRWLAEVETYLVSHTQIKYVFVESILEKGLIPFLTRHGYALANDNEPPSMYKRLT